jgi:hypothetical protein
VVVLTGYGVGVSESVLQDTRASRPLSVGERRDAHRDRVQPVAGRMDQRRECFAVAALRLIDEVSHPRSLWFAARMGRSPSLSLKAGWTFNPSENDERR